MQSAVSGVWVLAHLLVLSAEDLQEHQLFMPVVAELGLTGLFRILAAGEAPALLPGILLLAAGYLTEENIGYGDGWLVLALGMWMSSGEIFRMLLVGSVLSLIWGVCFHRKEVPFVPFLTAAYVIGEWV